MARRAFGGFEFLRSSGFGDIGSNAADLDFDQSVGSGATEILAAARSGRAGLRFPASNPAQRGDVGLIEASGINTLMQTVPVGTWLFFRDYVRFAALPSGLANSGYDFMYCPTDQSVPAGATGDLVRVKLDSGGKLGLFTAAGVQIGGDSALTVAASTLYRIEVGLRLGAGAGDDRAILLAALATDRTAGETVCDVSGLSLSSNAMPIGFTVLGGDSTVWNANIDHEDYAINDDTVPAGQTAGTIGAQDSFPGDGAVYLLDPLADVATGNWTNLPAWSKLDDRPPHATGATNATNANSSLDVEVEDLVTKGLDPAKVLAAMVIAGGTSSNGLPTVGIAGVSNPALAEVVYEFDTTALTFGRSEIAHLPSMAGATRPVIRMTRKSGNADQLGITAAGLLVEVTDRIQSGGPTMLLG